MSDGEILNILPANLPTYLGVNNIAHLCQCSVSLTDCQVEQIGVAVQQRPWLAVLEYMPYGDVRSVLMVRRDRVVLTRKSLSLICL